MDKKKGLLKRLKQIAIGVGVGYFLIPLVLLPLMIVTIVYMDKKSDDGCGSWQEVKLCDTGNAIKDLANESAIKNKNSEQYKLFHEGKYGEVKHDAWGLAYIEENGVKWYCNAFATYYTNKIGDKFKVTLESGEVIHVITCDIKADNHTHAGNNDSSPACLSADGSMMEFYGHVTKQTIPMLKEKGFGSINNDIDDEHKWKGSVVKIEKLGSGGACDAGGILEVEGVEIDFNSKYYTFNANGIDGNPCVCSPDNTVAWPYNNCNPPTSVTGSFNKMICSSYAAGRYWQVNYPDSNFPLPKNWDNMLTILHKAPANGAYSTDVNHPIPRSIISITFGNIMHDAFIEGVGDDGSVVISECNASRDNQYGFRVRKFDSLQAFLDSYGATLNGMYGK